MGVNALIGFDDGNKEKRYRNLFQDIRSFMDESKELRHKSKKSLHWFLAFMEFRCCQQSATLHQKFSLSRGLTSL